MKVYFPIPEKPSLPPAQEMAANAVKAGGRLLTAVLNRQRVMVDDDEFERRFSICQQCPKFIPSSNRCSVCGCILKSKVISKARMQTESCPDGKW